MNLRNVLLLAVALVSLLACKKQGPQGFKSLVDIQTEAPGAKCATGGLAVKSGIDRNNNNTLDADEVENTNFVCNGSTGPVGPAGPASPADKFIMIRLFEGVYGIGGAGNITYGPFYKFNKKNYPDVDSIVFAARPYINHYGTGGAVIVDLVNKTSNSVIDNSQMTGTKNGISYNDLPPFQYSKNIYNSIPDGDIDLGVKVTVQEQSQQGYVFDGWLFLYRK